MVRETNWQKLTFPDIHWLPQIRWHRWHLKTSSVTSASHRGRVEALHGYDPPPRVWPEALAAVLSLEQERHHSVWLDPKKVATKPNQSDPVSITWINMTGWHPQKKNLKATHTYRRLSDTAVRHQFVHINRWYFGCQDSTETLAVPNPSPSAAAVHCSALASGSPPAPGQHWKSLEITGTPQLES